MMYLKNNVRNILLSLHVLRNTDLFTKMALQSETLTKSLDKKCCNSVINEDKDKYSCNYFVEKKYFC